MPSFRVRALSRFRKLGVGELDDEDRDVLGVLLGLL